MSDKSNRITTTIEIDKDIFLKFKALCVLREKKISGEIEKMIRDRLGQLSENETINLSRE